MVPVQAPDQVPETKPAAPMRSMRRATARRASSRRASARSLKGDSEASIIDFLADHPRSTTGDLARGLNLDPELIATCLAHLTCTGEVRKTSHGYRRQAPGGRRV
jgi:predicted transcriptional regulator